MHISYPMISGAALFLGLLVSFVVACPVNAHATQQLLVERRLTLSS